MRVGVVGGGAAGLVAARVLRDARHDVVVFEQSDRVGGTWNWTDVRDATSALVLRDRGKRHPMADAALESDVVHSSMYDGLRTNLPKEVMGFRTLAFDASLPSFVRHSDVAAYLHHYAKHHDLESLVRLGTRVESVKRESDGNSWQVDAVSVDSRERTSESFDAMVVANGHYFRPYVPDIPGLDSFAGTLLHSHSYRKPDGFESRRCVVVGGGPSGTDIAKEIAALQQTVWMSLPVGETPNDPSASIIGDGLPNMDGRVVRVPRIERVDATHVHFADGSSLPVDVIIFGTGYHYAFPFLDPDNCGVRVIREDSFDSSCGRVVEPLYEHIVAIDSPTLFFVGIPAKVLPFATFEIQSLWIERVVSGDLKLPSKENMLSALHKDRETRRLAGLPYRYAHVLGSLQWEYCERLTRQAGVAGHPPFMRQMYEDTAASRRVWPDTYRDRDYTLDRETGNWTVNRPLHSHRE